MSETHNNLSHLAVVTALNEMLRSEYFSICTIDKCAAILGAPTKGSQAYNILSALHCVHYVRIPKPLRDQIPELIKQCLGVEAMPLLVAEEIPNRSGWVRRLLS